MEGFQQWDLLNPQLPVCHIPFTEHKHLFQPWDSLDPQLFVCHIPLTEHKHLFFFKFYTMYTYLPFRLSGKQLKPKLKHKNMNPHKIHKLPAKIVKKLSTLI